MESEGEKIRGRGVCVSTCTYCLPAIMWFSDILCLCKKSLLKSSKFLPSVNAGQLLQITCFTGSFSCDCSASAVQGEEEKKHKLSTSTQTHPLWLELTCQNEVYCDGMKLATFWVHHSCTFDGLQHQQILPCKREMDRGQR